MWLRLRVIPTTSCGSWQRWAVWLVVLTVILLAYGYWGWALLTLAGAVANTVLAYRAWQTTLR